MCRHPSTWLSDWQWQGSDRLCDPPSLLQTSVSFDLIDKLNNRWNLSYPCSFWSSKFKDIWGSDLPPKIRLILWLALHRGLWNGAKAASWGIGDGLCNLCGRERDTLNHAFFSCSQVRQVWRGLWTCVRPWHHRHLSWQEVLLGAWLGDQDFSQLWTLCRGFAIWVIWTARNAVFRGKVTYPSPLVCFLLIYRHICKRDMLRNPNSMSLASSRLQIRLSLEIAKFSPRLLG